ncbi:MAG: tetratricopeptide repeat protein [Lentisphaeria bacterium]|nr:tetratricopeptide repeat protein [Lentisphaeria bacterium]
MSENGTTASQGGAPREEPAISRVDGRLVISGALIHLANTGVVEAQLMLAKIHRDPHPQLHDMDKALRWLSAAAARGHTGAQLELGTIHLSGDGIPADPEKATQFYCDAALGGDPEGAYRLGMMFYLGKEIDSDWVSAHAWFSLAAELGRRDVKTALKNIKKKLSRDEKTEADALLLTLKKLRAADGAM